MHASIIVVHISQEKEIEYLNAAIHYIGELEKANNPAVCPLNIYVFIYWDHIKKQKNKNKIKCTNIKIL